MLATNPTSSASGLSVANYAEDIRIFTSSNRKLQLVYLSGEKPQQLPAPPPSYHWFILQRPKIEAISFAEKLTSHCSLESELTYNAVVYLPPFSGSQKQVVTTSESLHLFIPDSFFIQGLCTHEKAQNTASLLTLLSSQHTHILDNLSDWADFLIQTFKHTPPILKTDLDSFFLFAVQSITRLLASSSHQHIQQQLLDTPELSPEKFAEILQHVEHKISEKITLQDLTALSGLPMQDFRRHFKNVTQQTPCHFVKAARDHKARLLLNEPSIRIREIAIRCGLISKTQLSRSFKATFGLTPLQYRQSELSAPFPSST